MLSLQHGLVVSIGVQSVQMNNQNNNSRIELEKKLPKYLKVEEDLKYRILLGEWKPGDQILTEEELCRAYKVSRITVKRAISELELEGYLYQVSGKGTFVKDFQEEIQEKKPVAKSFTNEMRERGFNVITTRVMLDQVPADATLAKLLDIDPATTILQLKRVRAIGDGDIIAYSVNSFPFSKSFSADPRDYYGSLYEYLTSFGIYLLSAKEYLESMLPPSSVAEMLQIPQTDPVLKYVRISHNADYSFSEHNLCYYIGSKYRYYVNS